MDGQTEEVIDGRMDGWMNGWIAGRTERLIDSGWIGRSSCLLTEETPMYMNG